MSCFRLQRAVAFWTLQAWQGEKLVGNLDSASPIVEGQSIKVCLDLAQAHIFASGDEGCNLTLP